MMDDPKFPPYLTVKQLAKYIRISEQTVYRALKNKKIRGIRIGRSWRFRREYVEQLFNEWYG